MATEAISAVARTYAETLLALAERQGGTAVEDFARAADEVAALLQSDPRVRRFLQNPSSNKTTKKNALAAALRGRVPEPFLRFVLLVVDKGRERSLVDIAAAYRAQVDRRMNRVRAEVTTAGPADPTMQLEIQAYLERRLGKTVVATFAQDPDLLGGAVIRVEDQILDGSLRRRMADLKRRLLEARIPQTA